MGSGLFQRFGEDKLKQPFHGLSLLEWTVDAVEQCKAISSVTVVAGSEFDHWRDLFTGNDRVRVVHNPHYEEGQSQSIVRGVNALESDVDACVFIPGDMPLISTDLLINLIESFDPTECDILRTSCYGKPNSPVIFSRATFQQLAQLKGDEGGRSIFKDFRLCDFEWNHPEELVDIDTQDEYKILVETIKISAVVMAAGMSTRMGRSKLDLSYGDSTIIGEVLRALDQGGVEEIVVVLGGHETSVKIASLEAVPRVRFVYNADYETTQMLDSFKVGLQNVDANTQAVFVVPGDSIIRSGTVRALIRRFIIQPGKIYVPSFNMRRGHPWLISSRFRTELIELDSGKTFRDFLDMNKNKIIYINLESNEILMDIDTLKDYTSLNAHSHSLNIFLLTLDNYKPKNLHSQQYSSFDQYSQALPAGVYTTFRTYDGCKVLGFSDQIKRLIDSAKLQGHSINLDTQTLRKTIQSLLTNNGHDYRIRLHIPLENGFSKIYLMLENLHVPSSEDYIHGVVVQTMGFERENPESKSSAFINATSEIRSNLPLGVNEILMFDGDRNILEGMSSNFFGVMDGIVYTADAGVLKGLTRRLVLQICDMLKIKVVYSPINLENVANLDEAFITSASRAVLPIHQIDSAVIGDGNPGPITKAIADAFEREVQSRLESL